MQKFKQIRTLALQGADEEEAKMWDDARMIQKLAKEIHTLLGPPAGHGQEYPEMQDRGHGWGHGWVASTYFSQSKKTYSKYGICVSIPN